MKGFGRFLKNLIITVLSVALAFGIGFVGFQMLLGNSFKDGVDILGEFAGTIAGVPTPEPTYGVAEGEEAVRVTLGDGTEVLVSAEIASLIESGEIEIENIERLKEYIDIAESLGEITQSPQVQSSESPAKPKSAEDTGFTEAKNVAKSAIGRLSGAEIAELSAMLAGGISSEEKARAKEILFAKFSSSEIAYYQSLYNKYGKSLIE